MKILERADEERVSYHVEVTITEERGDLLAHHDTPECGVLVEHELIYVKMISMSDVKAGEFADIEFRKIDVPQPGCLILCRLCMSVWDRKE